MTLIDGIVKPYQLAAAPAAQQDTTSTSATSDQQGTATPEESRQF
jgi:hypothetical protein